MGIMDRGGQCILCSALFDNEWKFRGYKAWKIKVKCCEIIGAICSVVFRIQQLSKCFYKLISYNNSSEFWMNFVRMHLFDYIHTKSFLIFRSNVKGDVQTMAFVSLRIKKPNKYWLEYIFLNYFDQIPYAKNLQLFAEEVPG